MLYQLNYWRVCLETSESPYARCADGTKGNTFLISMRSGMVALFLVVV